MTITKYDIELITPRYDHEVYDRFYFSQDDMVAFAAKQVTWIEANSKFLNDAYLVFVHTCAEMNIEPAPFDTFARDSFIYRTYNFQEDVRIQREINSLINGVENGNL